MEIITKESTESTNDDIAELARKGYPHLTTVVAKYQTKGRGRRGNKWEAPRGNNLLFSTLIRSTVEHQYWQRIPQIAGMELINTVENLFYPEDGIKMKWPNDLYYYDKKWSGILVESTLGKSPFAILGIGVNCLGSAADYPEDLKGSITTVQEIFKCDPIEPLTFLKCFLERISENLVDSMEDFAPVAEFANLRDYLYGRSVTVLEETEKVAGTASGIGPEGELIVVQPNGENRHISSGTILEIE